MCWACYRRERLPRAVEVPREFKVALRRAAYKRDTQPGQLVREILEEWLLSRGEIRRERVSAECATTRRGPRTPVLARLEV